MVLQQSRSVWVPWCWGCTVVWWPCLWTVRTTQAARHAAPPSPRRSCWIESSSMLSSFIVCLRSPALFSWVYLHWSTHRHPQEEGKTERKRQLNLCFHITVFVQTSWWGTVNLLKMPEDSHICIQYMKLVNRTPPQKCSTSPEINSRLKYPPRLYYLDVFI